MAATSTPQAEVGAVGNRQAARRREAPPAGRRRRRRALSTMMLYPGCCEACFRKASACLMSSCTRRPAREGCCDRRGTAAPGRRTAAVLIALDVPTGLGARDCVKASRRGCRVASIVATRRLPPLPSNQAPLHRCKANRTSDGCRPSQGIASEAVQKVDDCCNHTDRPCRHSSTFCSIPTVKERRRGEQGMLQQLSAQSLPCGVRGGARRAAPVKPMAIFGLKLGASSARVAEAKQEVPPPLPPPPPAGWRRGLAALSRRPQDLLVPNNLGLVS